MGECYTLARERVNTGMKSYMLASTAPHVCPHGMVGKATKGEKPSDKTQNVPAGKKGGAPSGDVKTGTHRTYLPLVGIRIYLL